MARPRATYRLQLRGRVGFAEARAAVPYLERLGVSHLYASPILAARAGSTHGYDVTDPTRLDPALGSRADFDELVAALHDRDLGLVLDIVPNHLAASVENPWWHDLLQHGRNSRYEAVFDVDWGAPGLEGRILLPLLDGSPDALLAAGAIVVQPPVVRLPGGLELPLAPGTSTLDEQHYELADWRDANRRINYRRFFDVSDLVGVRAGDPEVFELTHRLVLDLVASGAVQGLRVDHVDGLRDPLGYLQRLRAAVGPAVPIWVEKILGPGESLPDGWPVEGTTGYEVAAAVVDALVDADGLARLEQVYSEATGRRSSFAEVAADSKREALRDLLASDVERVARALAGPLERSPEEVAPAIEEAAARLSVYRTYVRPGDGASPDDRAYLDEATEDEGLRGALLLDVPGTADGALRFQQLTGPDAAKGVEDTALYRHHALLARNEVGAHPGEAPGGPAAFHALAAHVAARWPATMVAFATHDAKRGPDVRARLLTLAEAPEVWAEAVARLSELDAAARPADAPVADANAAWLAWQTVVGAWPLDREADAELAERLVAYLVKAAREAKEGTSWTAPDEAYEAALGGLVERALDPAGALRPILEGLVERLAWPGAVHGLSLALLTLAGPGIPDLYQRSERWALTLVDPDNRRPVDIPGLAAGLEPASPEELLADWRDGRIKQHVVHRALLARRADPELFERGGHVPLDAGPDVLAFARDHGGRCAVCAVPRSPLRRPPVPTPLDMPDAEGLRWTDALTGDELDAPVAFARLPVALLVGR